MPHSDSVKLAASGGRGGQVGFLDPQGEDHFLRRAASTADLAGWLVDLLAG